MHPRAPHFRPTNDGPNAIQRWYDTLHLGAFSGNPPMLQWMGPNMWLHHRDELHPFQFIRGNGEVIEPGNFSTDGGTVPSIINGIPTLGPWYYGAAYLIHDWIWHQHKMHKPTYTFDESNVILCEAIKTLLEKGYLSHQTFRGEAGTAYNVWRGVTSYWARRKWAAHDNPVDS